MPEVICGVIHAHRIPLFETVAMNVDLVTVVICEVGRFRVVLLVKNVGEEVVQQLRDNALMQPMSVTFHGSTQKTCL